MEFKKNIEYSLRIQRINWCTLKILGYMLELLKILMLNMIQSALTLDGAHIGQPELGLLLNRLIPADDIEVGLEQHLRLLSCR
jgi:hypothetical protein